MLSTFYPPLASFSQLPYQQEVDSYNTLSTLGHSPEISSLRNAFGADLVHLIWFGDDVCGLA